MYNLKILIASQNPVTRNPVSLNPIIPDFGNGILRFWETGFGNSEINTVKIVVSLKLFPCGASSKTVLDALNLIVTATMSNYLAVVSKLCNRFDINYKGCS